MLETSGIPSCRTTSTCQRTYPCSRPACPCRNSQAGTDTRSGRCESRRRSGRRRRSSQGPLRGRWLKASTGWRRSLRTGSGTLQERDLQWMSDNSNVARRKEKKNPGEQPSCKARLARASNSSNESRMKQWSAFGSDAIASSSLTLPFLCRHVEFESLRQNPAVKRTFLRTQLVLHYT